MLQPLLYLIVSFLASVAGAICGIGGGVIIKPVLDLCALASVSTISFLSGCTVLSMSCYSVGRGLLSGSSKVDLKTGTPLALGAAVGGVAGKQLFSAIRALFADPNTVGAVQAGCLAVITAGTLAYTMFKNRIETHTVKSVGACVGIGLVLGVMSSFLGIGGGPINLVVLYYFFSMDSKTAALNSLYIIFLSQISSLLSLVFTGNIPGFQPIALCIMMAGGIAGAFLGRDAAKKLTASQTDRLFLAVLLLILLISGYNVFKFIA